MSLTASENDHLFSISSCLLGTLKESTSELPRRRNCDITYFVAKELLMTERTYKRDLELVTVVSTLSTISSFLFLSV